MMRFYKCKRCNKIVLEIANGNSKCCKETSEELIPNTVDASKEKHLPVIEINDNEIKVSIGSVMHPMSKEHLIEWVVLETNKGYQMVRFNDSDIPVVTFKSDDRVLGVYAYCNLHGLWKIESIVGD